MRNFEKVAAGVELFSVFFDLPVIEREKTSATAAILIADWLLRNRKPLCNIAVPKNGDSGPIAQLVSST